MRVTGLASGIDIDEQVKKMMAAKRVPMDKMSQNKQLLEWRRESYRELNSAIADFRYNKLDKFRLANATNVFSSTVTGNKTAVTAEATLTANQVDMKVRVEKLATQTTATSPALADSTTSKTKLSELGAVGNADGKVILEVSRGTGTPIKLEFSKDDTIQSVLSKINANTDAKLNASFDEASKKLIIKSKDYGADPFTLNGEFDTGIMKTKTPEGNLQIGEPAKVFINGKEHNPAQNEMTINGVKLAFLEESGNEESVITTRPDGNNLIGTIKNFVASYNNLINTLNSKVGEQKYKDFPPLTSEQREKMNEDDIKKWEAKAKSGTLKNDGIINGALLQMRSLLWDTSTKVGNKNLDLSSIGITTGEYTEKGKLYIDEEKLQQAINNNPDEIAAMFGGTKEKDGLFQRMYDRLLTPLTSISNKAGTSRYSADPTLSFNEQSIMGKELTDLNSRMAAFSKKLKTTEDSFYRQFNAMERAINKFNMQSASLANFAGQ